MPEPTQDGVRARRCVLALALCLCGGASSAQEPGARPEEFPRLDPYTRGEPKALERAGYVSFGPFPWLAEAGTAEIEEALGGTRVLWVETAHFRLGSTLATYRSGVDKREDEKLRTELERLSRKFERFAPERHKLDPWLRLHLFAQRLEEQYSEFLERFGFGDLEFDAAGERAALDRPALGTGPYLGMPMKLTVLLTESNATLGRFVGRFASETEACNFRGPLQGGTMFLGQSAECLRTNAFDLDAALHCAVAADLAFNLVDGFRGHHDSTPEWFRCGLASWFSRRIDERWTIYARGTTFRQDDDSWKWAPRVRGLVSHGLATPWSKMLEWRRWEDIDGPGHMLIWSRFDWLLARKDADLRAFLMGMTEPLILPRTQEDCLRAAFGASSADLDARWREFVLKATPRK